MRGGSDGFSQVPTPAGISRIRPLPGKQAVSRESEQTLFIFSTTLSPARLIVFGRLGFLLALLTSYVGGGG